MKVGLEIQAPQPTIDEKALLCKPACAQQTHNMPMYVSYTVCGGAVIVFEGDVRKEALGQQGA